ncbi:hypothetical protein NPS53_08385 [Pseudomonas putida]|uniref:hypothetical protein n=1 Tax=Pseudomonas putida TaxID=303 RepID=UPI00236430D5|nr:hypothetical protein [Pseudomonas putida]MDD2139589.1 hypothetical protein [Pseudomonas putida]HDS1721512.1 hypothetical protein [Pseudomonas putida]
MIELDALGQMIVDTTTDAEAWFVENFAQNGPVEGGIDGVCRYLLALGLRHYDAAEFATLTGMSEQIAQRLLDWLEAGTKL